MRNRIKHYRLLRGLQQKELAELVGVHPTAINAWELGRRDPSPAWQQDIAYALGVEKIEKVFPDWIPEKPVQSVQGLYKEREISSMGWLCRVANIKMGEKMLVKLSNVAGDGSTYCTGTVVEIQPSWFRVKLDKSGFSTCVHYQAFLKETGVRRPKNG